MSDARYYTERNGPDPDVSSYYQSVPMAMWITLVNLGGEAPLADYTVWGKVRLPKAVEHPASCCPRGSAVA